MIFELASLTAALLAPASAETRVFPDSVAMPVPEGARLQTECELWPPERASYSNALGFRCIEILSDEVADLSVFTEHLDTSDWRDTYTLGNWYIWERSLADDDNCERVGFSVADRSDPTVIGADAVPPPAVIIIAYTAVTECEAP
ncbi:hypothetical protein [Maricaulis sp.]|uniref:hypothetical protein n=1 Tax=Maricaulis sp. TaxID=1486257 RepID=UPI003A93FB63